MLAVDFSQGTTAAAAAAAAAGAADVPPTEAEVTLRTLLEPQGVPSELVTEVLRWRLAMPDCDRGVILDGLHSSLAAKGEHNDGYGDRGDGGMEGTGSLTAKAVAAAMPGAQLLVLQFKDGAEGWVFLNLDAMLS